MFGLYIHLPFCLRKCLTCNFYSIDYLDIIDSYLKVLALEASDYKHSIGFNSPLKINTIYIGGGTPSLLNISQINKIFEIIRKNFFIEKGSEITFEIHPRDFNLEKLKCLKENKVNRISLGINRVSKSYLDFMKRDISKTSYLTMVDSIRESGFSNLNIDFIFGYPGETVENAMTDLKEIINLSPEHISAYILTIEEDMQIYKKNPGIKEKINEDIVSEMYIKIKKLLKSKNYYQYEISNYAKKNFESKHNLKYWKQEQYIGLGAAAASYINNKRYKNVSDIKKYINDFSIKENMEEINPDIKLTEKIFLSLRLNSGLKFKRKAEEKYFFNKAKKYIKSGYMSYKNNSFILTDAGRLISNKILSDLI